MPLQMQPSYSFEEFRVDSAKRLLFRRERRILLSSKALDTLLVLLENRGRVVEKDELMRLVWPDTAVEENNLSQAISALRKALGEEPGQHRYIVTIPGRGYRFVGPVSASPESSDSVPDPHIVQPVFLGWNRPRRWHGRLGVPFGAAMSAVVITLVIYLAVQGHRPAFSASGTEIRSLAVLPLENLSHDPAEDYFADGMTDELITDLGQIRALRVTSRTSAMQYKGAHKSLPQIASELKVDAVVEGTVLRSGDRVRITAQLIQAPTDKHLWAQSYEGDLREALTLQDNVAADIAAHIRAQVTPQEQAKLKNSRPVNPAAYDAYLRGNYFADKRTAKDLTKAIEYFEKANRDDPNWAPAYAGLAEVYSIIPDYQSVPAREFRLKARAAAMRALQLSDSLAEVHTELADLASHEDFDWNGAEQEFQRAIELNPNSAVAHHFYGADLMCMGRWDEASSEMERARELDPLSVIVNANVGLVYYYARQHDKAIEAEQKALELGPNTAFIHEYLGVAYGQKRMYREAVGHLQKAVDLSENFPLYQAELALAYAAEGNRTPARRIVTNLENRARRQYVSSTALAVAYMSVGKKEAALARIQKAYEDREDQVGLFKIEPWFDSLHSDPRFQDVLRRIGLAEAPPATAQISAP
jgi:TolB-like protein/DNA-binding winged helix-turn-helix (wHTH) protein/Tfp pilus assembly protein PilF